MAPHMVFGGFTSSGGHNSTESANLNAGLPAHSALAMDSCPSAKPLTPGQTASAMPTGAPSNPSVVVQNGSGVSPDKLSSSFGCGARQYTAVSKHDIGNDDDDELLSSCLLRWAPSGSGATKTLARSTLNRTTLCHQLDCMWTELDSLLKEVAEEAIRDVAREVFVKARPDAANSWDSVSARIAMSPGPAELAKMMGNGGLGTPTIVEVSGNRSAKEGEGDDDMDVDENLGSANSSDQAPAPSSQNRVVAAPAMHKMSALDANQPKASKQQSKAKSPVVAAATPVSVGAQQAIEKPLTATQVNGSTGTSAEKGGQVLSSARTFPIAPEAAEFEEIVNSLPAQPFWKIPAVRADIPLGMRLRVFDNDGAREVASLAVTQPLIFGADAERAHVVERRGLGVYAEHVALVYSPKGFHLHPISGQSVLSAVTHHRPLLVKLRSESSKMPADRAEHCNTVLDALEKQSKNPVLFQPGDGRRKLMWQACVFSMGRSERIYFLDLITRGDLPDELDPDKKNRSGHSSTRGFIKTRGGARQPAKSNREHRGYSCQGEKPITLGSCSSASRDSRAQSRGKSRGGNRDIQAQSCQVAGCWKDESKKSINWRSWAQGARAGA